MISDLLDIKFYENKSNGICKGFALLSFASRESAEIALSKFSKIIIDGTQKLTTMPGTKQNYETLKMKVDDVYFTQTRHRRDHGNAFNNHNNNNNNNANYNHGSHFHNNFNNNNSHHMNAMNPPADLANFVQNLLKNPALANKVICYLFLISRYNNSLFF